MLSEEQLAGMIAATRAAEAVSALLNEVEHLLAVVGTVRGCGLVVDVEAGTVTGQGIHLTAGAQPEA